MLHSAAFAAIGFAIGAIGWLRRNRHAAATHLVVSAIGSFVGGWGLLLIFLASGEDRVVSPALPNNLSLLAAAIAAAALTVGYPRILELGKSARTLPQVVLRALHRPRRAVSGPLLTFQIRDWVRSRLSWTNAALTAIVVGAGVIRFWHLDQLGFQHWDEYYFLNDARIVNQLWPHGLNELGWVTVPMVAYTDGTLFHFLGVHEWLPFAVSATYGTLTPLATYFLGSRMYDRSTGLIAAAVLATAEFSVMYSRMALADATFNFWIVIGTLFVWLSFTRRRAGYYLLAGIATGITLNTKYTGAFLIILAGSWLAVELLVDSVTLRAAFLRQVGALYASRLAGYALMITIAAACFTPFLVKLSISPGFHEVLAHNGFFEVHQGSPIKTPPKIILWYFWLFTSPLTVLLAGAGLVVGLRSFSRADRLLLIYTAGWFLALMIFGPYPREALSLLPPVAVWSARAVVTIGQLAATASRRSPSFATPVVAVGAAAIVSAQFMPIPHLLSLRTQGYQDAAAIVAPYQSSGGNLFIHTQACALLYLTSYDGLAPTESGVILLEQRSPNLYFMTDQTLSWDTSIEEFFQLNRDQLIVVARVPNPIYPEVLLQPAYEDRLEHVNDPPDLYRYITIWKVTGPLKLPPSWPRATEPIG